MDWEEKVLVGVVVFCTLGAISLMIREHLWLRQKKREAETEYRRLTGRSTPPWRAGEDQD